MKGTELVASNPLIYFAVLLFVPRKLTHQQDMARFTLVPLYVDEQKNFTYMSNT